MKNLNLKAIEEIIAKIEKGEGLTIEELKTRYTLDGLYYKALSHVTTTNRAVCIALNIPHTHGSCFKRLWEKRGYLVQSQIRQICPATGGAACFLTTNPNEYDRVRTLKPTQPNPFREKPNFWINLNGNNNE